MLFLSGKHAVDMGVWSILCFRKDGREGGGCVCLVPKIWPLDDLQLDLLSHSSLLSVSFSALHHVEGQSVFPPPECIIRDGRGFSLHCVYGWLRVCYLWGVHFSGCLHLHFKGLRRDANDFASVQQYTQTHMYTLTLFKQGRQDGSSFNPKSKACCHYNRLPSYATEVFLEEKKSPQKMRWERKGDRLTDVPNSNRCQHHGASLCGCKENKIACHLIQLIFSSFFLIIAII